MNTGKFSGTENTVKHINVKSVNSRPCALYNLVKVSRLAILFSGCSLRFKNDATFLSEKFSSYQLNDFESKNIKLFLRVSI